MCYIENSKCYITDVAKALFYILNTALGEVDVITQWCLFSIWECSSLVTSNLATSAYNMQLHNGVTL